ncbi:MAG: ROK family transcriptional regulator [Bacteroidales bacterium]|nr:ROK family transcriptional regulator [Bacteroidales bacterium]
MLVVPSADIEKGKNAIAKREIIRICIRNEMTSIADINRELGISIPTVTKLVNEMIDNGLLMDRGKMTTSGGRRPSFYVLNPGAGFFVGVDVSRQHAHIAVSDFSGKIVHSAENIEIILENSKTSLDALCVKIKEVVTNEAGIAWNRVLGVGMSLSGRVNPEKGYSMTYFAKSEIPLVEILQEALGVPVSLENDSRAMCYGEYMSLGKMADKNMVFINISWGVGMGFIIDGKLYYGKSGFSGEIGHTPMLNNDILCRCGKVGCLETGASGFALHRMLVEEILSGKRSALADIYHRKKDIDFDDILNALENEDVLAIECLERVGDTLGRALASVINIFNPGLLVIGGRLIAGGDYLMLPIQTAINRYSMTKVTADSRILLSKLGRKAATLGDCLLSRAKMFELF